MQRQFKTLLSISMAYSSLAEHEKIFYHSTYIGECIPSSNYNIKIRVSVGIKLRSSRIGRHDFQKQSKAARAIRKKSNKRGLISPSGLKPRNCQEVDKALSFIG